MFGATSFIAVFYTHYFIRETQGLTDYQKKNIFAPKDLNEVEEEEDEIPETESEVLKQRDAMIEE